MWWKNYLKWLVEVFKVYFLNGIIGFILIIIGVIYLTTNVPEFRDEFRIREFADDTIIVIAQAFIVAGFLQIVLPVLTSLIAFGDWHKNEKQEDDIESILGQLRILTEKVELLSSTQINTSKGTGSSEQEIELDLNSG